MMRFHFLIPLLLLAASTRSIADSQVYIWAARLAGRVEFGLGTLHR
ncbi:TPA: hypothetical protein ACXE03_002742 [Klebsiella michiganensis]